jgi:hypothetical protein
MSRPGAGPMAWVRGAVCRPGLGAARGASPYIRLNSQLRVTQQVIYAHRAGTLVTAGSHLR